MRATCGESDPEYLCVPQLESRKCIIPFSCYIYYRGLRSSKSTKKKSSVNIMSLTRTSTLLTTKLCGSCITNQQTTLASYA